MKKPVLTLATLLLVGCSPVIDSSHISRSVKFCEDHGGVSRIYADTVFALIDLTELYYVKCQDGKTSVINNIK